jgi:protein-tyrosine phosphatase
MIADVHSHILPGIDDGSASPEESAVLLTMLKQQNVPWVAATPHFYPSQDRPHRFLERRAAALEQLNAFLGEDAGIPPIIPGAEVYYYAGMSDSEALKELTFGGTDYLLVEMPMSPWTESMFRELDRIHEKQGLIPVVAHVDRYIQPLRDHGIPRRLEELPVLVQANAGFFLRPSTRSMALRMLKKGQIHLLGSDCHSIAHRPPRLGEAVEVIRRKLGEAVLEQLAENGKEIYL